MKSIFLLLFLSASMAMAQSSVSIRQATNNPVPVTLFSTNLDGRAFLFMTNITFATTNPVSLGAASWKIWSISVWGGMAGRTNNTNTVWLQVQNSPLTNGLAVPPGTLATWTMPVSKFTTADMIFLQGGTNENATVYTTY